MPCVWQAVRDWIRCADCRRAQLDCAFHLPASRHVVAVAQSGARCLCHQRGPMPPSPVNGRKCFDHEKEFSSPFDFVAPEKRSLGSRTRRSLLERRGVVFARGHVRFNARGPRLTSFSSAVMPDVHMLAQCRARTTFGSGPKTIPQRRTRSSREKTLSRWQRTRESS